MAHLSAPSLHAAARFRLALRPLQFLAAVLLWPAAFVAAKALTWDPIPPADLAAKVSPSGADAEILFKREHVDEDNSGYESSFYLRVKIYTASGIGRISRMTIDFPDYETAKILGARVAKTDGSFVTVPESDFHETDLVKSTTYGSLYKYIAFAFPNLAPGDIVEIQWKMANQSSSTRWTYLRGGREFCQEDIPVREFTLSMSANYAPVISWLNCANVTSSGDRTTEPRLTIRDQPPFVSEPFMPPEAEVRGWIRIEHPARPLAEEWRKIGQKAAQGFIYRTGDSSAIRKLAASLTEGVAAPAEKLHRIYDFCQQSIANDSWKPSDADEKKDDPTSYDLLDDELFSETEQSLKAPHVLNEKHSTRDGIDDLFASLARTAGFEVRLARNAPLDTMVNVQGYNNWFKLDHAMVAVKFGGQWRFFDPGAFVVPFGMNEWRNEGVLAFVAGDNDSAFFPSPTSPPEQSVRQRTARLHLDSAGTLVGEITVQSSGHRGEQIKEDHWHDRPDALEKFARDEIAQRLPAAEVSDIRWENLHSRDQPAILHYKVRVPGYAQKIGHRLLLPPNFFEAGTAPLFSAPQRRFPILFPFAWQDRDDIEIELPPGFELDHPNAPADLNRPNDPFAATFVLRFVAARHTLVCTRDLLVGRHGRTAYRVEDYPYVKAYFEALHRSDTHTLMLKPTTPSPAKTEGASVPAAAHS